MVAFKLNDKIALITGASRGIGESIAMALADYGAACILVSRKIAGLQAVQEKINAKGGQAEVMACNMGELDQVQSLCDQIKSRFGRLDILVNNAATNPYFGPMLGAPESAWNWSNH